MPISESYPRYHRVSQIEANYFAHINFLKYCNYLRTYGKVEKYPLDVDPTIIRRRGQNVIDTTRSLVGVLATCITNFTMR